MLLESNLAAAVVMGAAMLFAPSAVAAEDMNDAVKKLEAAVKKLETTEKSLSEFRSVNASALRQVQEDMESLKARVRQLEDEVKTLRPPSSTSKLGPADSTIRTGRIRLTNDYLEEMSVVINGMSYRLPPGQSRTVSVPAGTFTYQVLQLQRIPQERFINPDEEKPIRIFTQRP